MRHLRHVASLDEVRITREPDGETALIEYDDDAIGGTHFKLGPVLHTMTDAEVLERFNDMIAAMEAVRNVFGDRAIVQRCQAHKTRNVVDQLPDDMKPSVRQALREAYA